MLPVPLRRFVRRCGLLCALAFCAPAGPPALHAQQAPADEPLPPNPFAGFQTYRLANGLKVWYGELAGATLTSMALVVPYGRDQDPPGREQTAHLLEHVLLSDRHGRTEAELVRELTGRGGSHNGVTGPRYTYYPLSIGTGQAAWGLNWLYGVVAPRPFSAELVERNREPVAIELSARRIGFLSGAAARYVSHPLLLPAPFWRREFGLHVQEERGADQRSSLAAITADDLRAFYDTYYVPTRMTLVIVTGAPFAELQPALDSTFALLPWRPEPVVEDTVTLRTTASRLFQWRPGTSTRLAIRFRLREPSGLDHLRLVFIEDLLRHRLMERLRRGEAKSVYSITTGTAVRGPAAWFGIHADLNPGQERRVRAIIDDELHRLTDAADTIAFYADRDALSRRIRVENASPAALRAWAVDRFNSPDLYRDFPDVAAYYATVGPDSIAALAARLFVEQNRMLSVWRPLPLPAAVLVALAVIVVLLAARLYRVAALVPADMQRVRFIARLRPPPLARLAGLLAGALALLGGGRLAVAGVHITAANWLFAVDSFALVAAAVASLLFSTTLLVLAVAGRLHAKVLVFEHEVRIKSPTAHAVVLPAHTIRQARLVDRLDGLTPRRFVMPPLGSGVWLELDDGTGYVLRMREPARLLDALRRFSASTSGSNGTGEAGAGGAGAVGAAGAETATLA